MANGLLSQSSPFFNPDMTTYSYDPDAAKALLAEDGWTPGSDGICTNDDGDRLAFDLATTAGNQTREQIALVIQSQLEQICIAVTPKFVSLQTYNGELSRRREFTGMIMSSIRFSPSTSPAIALATDKIPNAENNFVGNNFSGYSNPDMDAALEEFQQALDQDGQKAAWQKIQAKFAADLPMLPLYFYTEAYVTVPDLKGFRLDTYDPLMIWANDWYRD